MTTYESRVSVAVRAEAASAARAYNQRITIDDLAAAMRTSRTRAADITAAMLETGLWVATGSTGGTTQYGRPGGLDIIGRIT